MNRYLVEFVGTMFFAYVILSTGNALAIGAPKAGQAAAGFWR